MAMVVNRFDVFLVNLDIMSSENLLKQIKNSHSLLPASRDPPLTPYAIALTQKFNKQKQARYL
ncbi:hypothetical protein BCD67_19365 [Oscillatoriales cyanobacterium USR001]|nr:hypothetical protein BCD67_19365 [Oscillatoriales cyanobacterium USR001]